MKDQVFTLDGQEWQIQVSGRILGGFYSRGHALAGVEVELRRQERFTNKVFYGNRERENFAAGGYSV